MKLTAYIFISLLILNPVLSLAGSNHDHGQDHSDHSHSHIEVDQHTAKQNAIKIVEALAKREKIDQTWVNAVVKSVERKVFKGNPEWLIIFDNQTIDDKAKTNLYIFLTLGGDYIAANYTGK